MIRKDDVVAAGISGGADSVCLLFVLCALREKLGFRVYACHVNHGLRGEAADRDEEFVRRLCGELQVPCRFFHENVELTARKRKQSHEEAGRALRREAFETMCRENGCTKIATAHHRDDNAETVLLNIARGTGLKGLCGIRPARGKWIRPLLFAGREQIAEYLEEKGTGWCEDATNSEDIYTRNRIRHHILPALGQQVNTGVSFHLNELARQACDVWDYLEAGVDQAWKNCVSVTRAGAESAGAGLAGTDLNGAGLEIDGRAFAQEMPAVRTQLVRRCIAFVRGEEKDIGAVHIEAVERLFSRPEGKMSSLPGGVCARRTRNGVSIRPAGADKEQTAEEKTEEVTLQIPGVTKIPGENCEIVCRFVENADVKTAQDIPQKSYTKWIDYDIIEYSLSARTRRAGDYLVINKNGGRQKLKAYYMNEKIPREERERLLLIADGGHVVWIPGYRMSRAYQIGSGTKKILEIKLTEERKDVRDDQSAGPGGEG